MSQRQISTLQRSINQLKRALYNPTDNERQLQIEVEQLRDKVTILENRVTGLTEQLLSYQLNVFLYTNMKKQFVDAEKVAEKHGRKKA